MESSRKEAKPEQAEQAAEGRAGRDGAEAGRRAGGLLHCRVLLLLFIYSLGLALEKEEVAAVALRVPSVTAENVEWVPAQEAVQGDPHEELGGLPGQYRNGRSAAATWSSRLRGWARSS